jgi:hypothetical protein
MNNCKFCGKVLDTQPEFCDGLCAESYFEQEEENEHKKKVITKEIYHD